ITKRRRLYQYLIMPAALAYALKKERGLGPKAPRKKPRGSTHMKLTQTLLSGDEHRHIERSLRAQVGEQRFKAQRLRRVAADPCADQVALVLARAQVGLHIAQDADGQPGLAPVEMVDNPGQR